MLDLLSTWSFRRPEMKVDYLFNLHALYKDSGAFPKGKQDHVWWVRLELSHLPPEWTSSKAW